jgi:hypothetical protein
VIVTTRRRTNSSVQRRVHRRSHGHIDLVVPSQPVSEWERVIAAATPLLKGQGVEAESLTDTDIQFIAAGTGLDPDSVRLWSLATKAASETKKSIDAAVFYGGFRQGLQRSLSGVLSEQPDRLRAQRRRARAGRDGFGCGRLR